jgi:hypothetical protein
MKEINRPSQPHRPARANHYAPSETDGNEVPESKNAKTHWNITDQHISALLTAEILETSNVPNGLVLIKGIFANNFNGLTSDGKLSENILLTRGAGIA